MTKFHKKPSKRQTLHQKHKVERKVRDHHRKVNRELKKNPISRKTLKKDPGIPNLWPYKEQLLQHIKSQQERIVLEKKQQQEVARKRRLAGEPADNASDPPATEQSLLTEMAADANSRSKQFEKEQKRREKVRDAGVDFRIISENSKRQFYREVKKVIEASDVILEVLDARDPLGCRCRATEQHILKTYPSKKIILILNKIDLVPKEVVVQWLKHLRDEFPCIAFKCTTSNQRTNLGQSSVSATSATQELLDSKESIGASNLLSLLKNYSRSLNMKTSIAVGIIGYPNVGKSSLINSLVRSRATGVGATPGFTKTMQEVHLDKQVRLLDCPGVVFAEGGGDDEGSIVLRNCVKVENISDPIKPVEEILKRCKATQLMSIFKLGRFKDTTEFLSHVARRFGRLAPGGIPEYDAAARYVIKSWNAGLIPYFCVPPSPEEKKDKVHLSSEIVQQWAPEFDIDTLNDSTVQLDSLTSINDLREGSFVLMSGESKATGDAEFVGKFSQISLNDKEHEEDKDKEGDDDDDDEEEDDDQEEEDDQEEPGYSIPVFSKPLKKVPLKGNSDDDDKALMEDPLNPQVNRKRKLQTKKNKKSRRKQLSRHSVPAMDDEGDDNFSFENDFQGNIQGDEHVDDEDDDDDDSHLLK